MKTKKPIVDSMRTKTKESQALFFFMGEEQNDPERLARQITESLKKAGIDIPVVVLPHGIVKMEVLSSTTAG